jgi:superfamily II RNA helicase
MAKFQKPLQMDRHTWQQLVKYLEQRTLLPAVIFIFSKRRCEEYVATLSGLDLTTTDEKSRITLFLAEVVAKLQGVHPPMRPHDSPRQAPTENCRRSSDSLKVCVAAWPSTMAVSCR